MINPFFNFTIKACVALAITFLTHIAILYAFGHPPFENFILLSYVVNFILIIKVFGILYLLRKKYKSQLGFLFLAGSLIKFAVFFIVFLPRFKQDGTISKLEFASFFIPYVIGLILETTSLSKWLKNLDETAS